MSNFIWFLAILVFFLDQLTKFFISRYFDPHTSLEIIKGIFYLALVHNTGAAFGIFKNQTLFFIVVSILAVATIVIYVRKKTKRTLLLDAALALILGGALGNLVDRLRFGYVIDFLDFRIWPVFNTADSAITIGAFLLILSSLLKKQE
ncbi:MAG: signal peptidase II [Candidatus Omnitrophica bacterium]|nr:signal peptidase II [Candidatus Omnitrophota bacterium]